MCKKATKKSLFSSNCHFFIVSGTAYCLSLSTRVAFQRCKIHRQRNIHTHTYTHTHTHTHTHTRTYRPKCMYILENLTRGICTNSCSHTPTSFSYGGEKAFIVLFFKENKKRSIKHKHKKFSWSFSHSLWKNIRQIIKKSTVWKKHWWCYFSNRTKKGYKKRSIQSI